MTNLKRIREEKKKTQREVAKAIGSTRELISAVESGRVNLSLDKARRVAEFLDVTVDELIKD